MNNTYSNCPCCDASDIELVCQLSKNNISITSDSKYSTRLEGACCKCNNCGHIFNDIQGSLSDFYSSDYELLTEKAQQDQLIFLPNNEKIYRSNFQAQILKLLIDQLSKLKPTSILEVGAGKGLTAQKFNKILPEMPYYLHEVTTEKYINFWSQIATNSTLDDGQSKHDLVVSFFTLEHCPIGNIFSSYLDRVTDKGVILLTVPNLLVNAGDLMVVDHVNHFTADSLCKLFSIRFGSHFNVAISKDMYPRSLSILVSSFFETHQLQHILNSISSHLPSSQPKEDDLSQLLLQLSNANQFIKRFTRDENNIQEIKYAFWGSGFYAKFFALHMSHRLPVSCFDSNSDLVGSKLIFADGLCIPIEHSKDIIDSCLSNDIHNVLLTVSPQAAFSIQSSFANLFRENKIKLLNPWLCTA